MFTAQNTLSISDLRKNTLEVLEKIDELDEPMTVFSNSKPVAMMMSIAHYQRLQDRSDSEFDPVRYKKAMEFLVHPPKDLMIKTKGFNAVKAIRELRD